MCRSETIVQWVTGPRVLDVGCAGHVPKPDSPEWLHGLLRRTFPSVRGVDINRSNLDRLTQAGFTGLYLASAEDFSLPEKFNTIVAGEVIEHLSNPGLFLRRCSEHLVPTGRIVITTPYPFSLLYLCYAALKFPKTCQNQEHTCWFCPATLEELASRHSFQVRHWELIEDYDPADPSLRYRNFTRLVSTFHPLIPKRFRNNGMLFVLERDDSSGQSDTLHATGAIDGTLHPECSLT